MGNFIFSLAAAKEKLRPPLSFYELTSEERIAITKNKSNLEKNFLVRIIALITLGRPRTCIVGFVGFMLGYSYTGAGFSFEMLLGAFLSLLIGFSANLHNTYTDLEEDSVNIPGRLFVLTAYGYRNIFNFLVLLDIFMIFCSALLGLHFFIFMLLAVLGLQQYSFPPVRAKSKPVLGLWVFAQAVVFPFIFGWTIKPEPLNAVLLPSIFSSSSEQIYNISSIFQSAIPLSLKHLFDYKETLIPLIFQGNRYWAMYLFLTIWFIAKGTFKNVPDYYGDKSAGIKTSATAFSSYRRAAWFTTLFTFTAYLSLVILVWQGLESAILLYSLIWLVPAMLNCQKLISAKSSTNANECLKIDMFISVGFISTILLLIFPTSLNIAFVAIGLIILALTDSLKFDSRQSSFVSSISPEFTLSNKS